MMRQVIPKNIPDTPGVYLFKKGKGILYIGKATSLKDRVRSYFSGDIAESRGARIVKMLEEAQSVSWQETDSVLEALILEAALIKKHQPPYNAREKSDKSFLFVGITDEDFPRVITIRERNLQTTNDKLLATFGPFPHASQLKEALKIVRKIFPFRGEKDPVSREKKGKSYLNRELGLVPDFNVLGKRGYARTIKNIILFFEGKKGALVKKLEREMKSAAHKHEFEEAEHIKRQIFALNHIRDVSLIKNPRQSASIRELRVEAYDVAHIAGTNRVGVMTVVECGEAQRSEYRTFNIKTVRSGDTDALREILERRLAHSEWQMPNIIVVDGGVAQERVAHSVLKSAGVTIPVVAVTKNAAHRPQAVRGPRALVRAHEADILLANSEAHRFSLAKHRRKRKISRN